MTPFPPSIRWSDRSPEVFRTDGEGPGQRQRHVFNLGTIMDTCGASSTYNTRGICAERSSFTRADDMGRSRFPRCKISPNFGLQMLSEVKTIFSFSRTLHRSSEPVRGPEARWRLRKTRQALGPGPSVPRREYGRACENRGSRS